MTRISTVTLKAEASHMFGPRPSIIVTEDGAAKVAYFVLAASSADRSALVYWREDYRCNSDAAQKLVCVAA